MAAKKTTKTRTKRLTPVPEENDPAIDSAAEFERLIKQAAKGEHYVLRADLPVHLR